MDLFNIWSPYLSSPRQLSFDVTPAEGAIVKNGTPSFVASCLNACGISVRAKAWNVGCVRQSYYSDYLHSADWRARWDIAWTFEVTLSAAVHMLNHRRLCPCKTDAQDESSQGSEEPTIDTGPALLIADFSSATGLEEIIARRVNDWKRGTAVSADPQIQYRRYTDGHMQARLVVEHVKFPHQLTALDALQTDLREIGGVTNWRDLATSAASGWS